ncbi:hypothetical protein ASG92_12450 [Arthrobacter sp. Soil736]|uniref:hypothetical protein n=1 Tax=Arthrobacter sp. Soil736 TaxID=1736395 RepID=UPI00070165CB|nr:hypothetical protein [Arthrobacter sp. Soil736]KRE45130.1 hypothetical protein ASG92_12450 [Arthrobacter sp. Soil736]
MLETARNTRTDGRRDLVTELLGLWLVLAVFLDGWAHLNLPSLETFFTPWHAALYSGMLATAAWTAVVIWRTPLESGATTAASDLRKATASRRELAAQAGAAVVLDDSGAPRPPRLRASIHV